MNHWKTLAHGLGIGFASWFLGLSIFAFLFDTISMGFFRDAPPGPVRWIGTISIGWVVGIGTSWGLNTVGWNTVHKDSRLWKVGVIIGGIAGMILGGYIAVQTSLKVHDWYTHDRWHGPGG